MKKLLFAAVATAALGMIAPQAGAQTKSNLAHPEIYMQKDDTGSWRLYGPEYPEGRQVLLGEKGARPASCPEGAYFIEQDTQSDEFKVMRGCTTTEEFDVGAMPSGMMQDNGKPFPEDSYAVTPRNK